MDEYLSALRKHEEMVRCKREQHAAEKVNQSQWPNAWVAVQAACAAGDADPECIPDLSPFRNLAKLIKKRGFDGWLPEMAANFVSNLDDPYSDRLGHLCFVRLLMLAGTPGITRKKLETAYLDYVPAHPQMGWRISASEDVHAFFHERIRKAEDERIRLERKRTEQDSAERIERIRNAAGRRGAIRKQLFAVYWSDQGLGPAAIREKWNKAHPKDPVDSGRPGRHDLTIAIQRGREFLAIHGTTASELAELLDFKLGR